MLAARVETILSGDRVPANDVQRATLAVVRYALRASGRATPFGMFAGVSAVSVGETTKTRLGQLHQPVAHADTRWIHQVVELCEQSPDLLARLDVTFNDAAEFRGERVELPGPDKISIRRTSAVMLLRDEATSPVQVGALADKLAQAFPAAGDPLRMLTSLVQNGFLLTSLRAPSTITDPLGFVLDRLREVGADNLPVAPLIHELDQIHEAIRAHNHAPHEDARTEIAVRMRTVVDAVRDPIAVDLRLDADVQVPRHVAREMERAASVLAKLARQTTGAREWREYFTAFCERYGQGTLVPLRVVLDPDAGIGVPRGYPGSGQASGRRVFSERDELLFAFASGAAARGEREIELDEDTVEKLVTAGGGGSIPPHVDVGARIHASSKEALDRGEFTFTVTPGRVAGTLTSRFTTLVPEAGLDAIFASLPTTAEGALPVQLSFPPIYPSAENVCRVPQYLPNAVSVGEHAPTGAAIRVDDLAVTATDHHLHLVSLSRQCVVEPLVLHALAPKQMPPMARMVGELSRALGVDWIGFDWGAAEKLPFRPRLRYRKAVLSSAKWRLVLDDLPANEAEWGQALDHWRAAWRCPRRVELRDFDQLLPLDLDEPSHREVLYRHLRQHGDAVLLEAVERDAGGWLDGQAHTVVLPMTSTRAPVPAPKIAVLPIVDDEHGHPPASARATWLYAKLFLSAGRIDELIVNQLPALLSSLGDRDYWFVRYPQAREGEEADHLRLRIRLGNDTTQVISTVSAWADKLRASRLIGRWAFDTYFPETGRYTAIEEAEQVFAADSRLVLAQLTHLRLDAALGTVVTALSLFDVATAFLGSRDAADDWLNTQVPHAIPDRTAVDQVKRLAGGEMQAELPGWAAVADKHRARADAVHWYRRALPTGVDTDKILHSLLHMHHNRALGVDRTREAVCLRLARQAAATWRAYRRNRA
ncbi:lantibiotic dehydratase [Saccharopolyspora taberi]|uniref:Lantibiotic dehydratase n=1 Tax=Saccharopolyspora taberi TaxID=60895 RepID=A0ABN3VKI8_9PSEU